jgi:hypothetical protein
LFLLFTVQNFYAQDFWANYLLKKETGLFSVLVNMELDYAKPNYKNVLIIGKQTDSCYANGFPKVAGLKDLMNFSDATSLVLDSLTKHKLAGIITYKCSGFDVYYIKDTTNVRDRLQKLIDRSFQNSNNFFFMQRDKKWNYYYGNLFPAYYNDDFFADQDYLLEMVEAGDDLSQDRDVSHWFYFNSDKKREKFKENVEKLEFSIDSLVYNKDKKYPYEIKITRKEEMDPEHIMQVTSVLRTLSLSFNGQYDGWSTETIVKE